MSTNKEALMTLGLPTFYVQPVIPNGGDANATAVNLVGRLAERQHLEFGGGPTGRLPTGQLANMAGGHEPTRRWSTVKESRALVTVHTIATQREKGVSLR